MLPLSISLSLSLSVTITVNPKTESAPRTRTGPIRIYPFRCRLPVIGCTFITLCPRVGLRRTGERHSMHPPNLSHAECTPVPIFNFTRLYALPFPHFQAQPIQEVSLQAKPSHAKY